MGRIRRSQHYLLPAEFRNGARRCGLCLFRVRNVQLKDLNLAVFDKLRVLSEARMVAATFHPCLAKCLAVNLPNPLLVPVMKTVSFICM